MAEHPLPLTYAKEWYSPNEVAVLLGRAAYTIREYCRLQRIHSRKRPCGRGKSQEWEIHKDEILRFQNHGLLPSIYAKKSRKVSAT